MDRSLPPVLVTRPEAAGRRLADALIAAGVPALWLPAFELGPAPEPAHVEGVLARLADFDLAIFVSPAAVQATARHLRVAWPRATTIGVAGAATGAAARECLPGAEAAPIVAPAGADASAEAGIEVGTGAAVDAVADAGARAGVGVDTGNCNSGSEALWEALAEAGVQPRAVLILRAEHGREWLVHRLQAAGAAVTTLAVYTRKPAVLDAASATRLSVLVHAGRAPYVLVTSSEAVAALRTQVEAIDGAWAWLRGGCALAIHPRIEAQLRAAGFARVVACRARVAAIRMLLEADTRSAPAAL